MRTTALLETGVSLEPISRGDDREAFDCFNEDLTWILDKLVNRTGGVAGVLSGHLQDESAPTLLASSSTSPEPSDLCSVLVSRGVRAPAGTQSNPDQPTISHSLMQLASPEGASRRYRVLQLSFAPATGVKVVATIAKDSRRGFRFVEEAAAVRLYPVLSRYIRLWWRHRAERRRAHTLSVIADMSDLGIFLLNRHNELLFANARARSLFQAHDGLTVEGQGVHAIAPGDQESWSNAIMKAQRSNQSARGARRVSRISKILHLQRASGQRNLIVAVMPVAPPAVDDDDTAVVIYGLDPDQNVSDLLTPVCDIYGLTPAESRVVQHLITGSRITEAARLMAVQPQTARAYLKRIFLKTRTHRQADLVRIMLSSALRTTATIDPPS